MEYQRNSPDSRVVKTHRAVDSALLQTPAGLLLNRQLLRSRLVGIDSVDYSRATRKFSGRLSIGTDKRACIN
jgi:hypothetical protein